MKRFFAMLVILCVPLVSSNTFAWGFYSYGKGDKFHKKPVKEICHKKWKKCDKKPPKDPVTTVPEINGASTGIAFALIGGIVLIVRERRRITRDTDMGVNCAA